jgi:hypothetical protein
MSNVTHEQWIHAVRVIAVTRLVEVKDRDKLMALKLTYGAGSRGVRGVTFYDQWQSCHSAAKRDFIAICATGEESLAQLAGTVIHELGHALVGAGGGHSATWKTACARLGLRHVKATDTRYTWAGFDPEVRQAIAALPEPNDGKPTFKEMMPGEQGGMVAQVIIRGCQSGIGTRGGKSRGQGSGSRMRKYTCQCGQIIRAATDTLAATHDKCASAFTLTGGGK